MKYSFILICLFAFLNTQTIDAQMVIHEKYASGQPQIQYHIRQKDTFRTDKLFENGHFYQIEWRDSVHVFYENGVISKKMYPQKAINRDWLSIAMNVLGDHFRSENFESNGNKRTYFPDGNLETELIWTGDSLVQLSFYFPNGQSYASMQYHHPNSYLFKSLEINGNETIQAELDTITKIRKQFGYRNHQLLQYEESRWLSEDGANKFTLLKQVLNDSTGKLDFAWQLDSLKYKLDKDNALCLYGFRNMKTDWAITPRYETVKEFNNAYFIVSQNGKYGIIDESGNTTTPLKWDFLEDISSYRFGSSIDLHPPVWQQNKLPLFHSEMHKPNLAARLVCRKGKLCGVIDCFGNTILEPVYQEIRQYENGLYEVRKGKLWGLVDKNGQTVVEPKYVGIYFTPYKDLFYVYDTICIPNKETYNSIKENKELHLKENELENLYKSVISHEKFGLVNDKGKTLLPCVFEHIEAEAKNRCFNIAIYNLKEPEYYRRYGLFHAEKGWLIDTTQTYSHEVDLYGGSSFELLYRKGALGEKRCALYHKDKNQLLLNFDYQEIRVTTKHSYHPEQPYTQVHPPVYDFFKEDALFLCKKDHLYGLYDGTSAKWVMPIRYDTIKRLDDSLYAVSYKGKWQFVNQAGEPILPQTFEDIGKCRMYHPFEKSRLTGYFAATKDTFLLYRSTSFPKTTRDIDAVTSVADDGDIIFRGLTLFHSDDKQWGINQDGKLIVAPPYYFRSIHNGFTLVQHKTSKQQQIIDNQGNIKQFNPKYEIKYVDVNADWALVRDRQTGRLGMVTMAQKEILPCQFFGMTGIDTQGVIWARKDFLKFKTFEFLTIKSQELNSLDSNWQMYDKTGHLLTNVVFDYPFLWANHLGIGQVRGKQGLWNAKGKAILPPQYDKIWYDSLHHIFHLFQLKNGEKDKVGFANADGQIVINMTLKNMSGFTYNDAFVETLDGHYGIIQKNGQYRITPKPYALQQANFSITDTLVTDRDLFFGKYSYMYDHRTLFAPPYPYNNEEREAVETALKSIPTLAQRQLVENVLLEFALPAYFLNGKSVDFQRNRGWYGTDSLYLDHKEPSSNFEFAGRGEISNLLCTKDVISFRMGQRYNFKLKNNIWSDTPLTEVLLWNEANETVLNQLMLKKISALKHQSIDCGDPTAYMKRVQNEFYILPEGLQFFMPLTGGNNRNVPILFTWAELQPFLLR
jgi:WG containing repeat